MRVLQRGDDRTVLLEEDGLTVRKTFVGTDSAVASELAAREFDRMQRFSLALADIAAAACARPIDLKVGDQTFVRMERARGMPLQDHLQRTVWRSDLREQIATVLRISLTRYVETFDEPYWDFIFRNMFYDPDFQVVTFLDFAVPTLYLPALDRFLRYSPIEISLGSLVASSIFEAARPKRMTRLREHRQAYPLAAAVVTGFLDDPIGPRVDVENVRQAARIAYGLATGYGGWARRGWYRICGRSIARPSIRLARLRAPS